MLDKSAVISDDMAYRLIDGEAILVSARSGKVISLNPIGSSIWQLIDSNKSVADIISSLCEEYEVTESQAREDVIEFLQQLLDRDIISFDDK